VFPREGEGAEDPADPGRGVMPMDVIADGADRRAGVMGGTEQRDRLRGRAARVVRIRRSCAATSAPRRS